jgi:hypothetical protein
MKLGFSTPQITVWTPKEEFEQDGLKFLRGNALKEVCDLMSLSPSTPQSAVWIPWTPRSALRLGMLLRDSEVAKFVRHWVSWRSCTRSRPPLYFFNSNSHQSATLGIYPSLKTGWMLSIYVKSFMLRFRYSVKNFNGKREISSVKRR